MGNFSQLLNNFCAHPENIFVVVGRTPGEEQNLPIRRDGREAIQSSGIDRFAQINGFCPVAIGLPEADKQIALVGRRKSSSRTEDQVTFVGSDKRRPVARTAQSVDTWRQQFRVCVFAIDEFRPIDANTGGEA